MRLVVDLDVCEANGQCAISAPELFTLEDDGHLVYVHEVADERLDEARDAVEVCPVQAIVLEDDAGEPDADRAH